MTKLTRTQKQDRVRALLKDLRVAAGIRQQVIADRIGEPQSFVSKYENGERRLDVIELSEICAALGVSLTDFLDKLEI